MSGCGNYWTSLCNSVTWLLALAVTSGSSFAVEPNRRQENSPAIYDTDYEIVHMVVTPSLHWIDSERLMFVGMKAGHGPRSDERKIYLWAANGKSVKSYAEGKVVCTKDGIVRYEVRVDEVANKRIFREGPLGGEREVEEPLSSNQDESRGPAVYSNFTCSNHWRSKLNPPAQRFRHVVVLKDGDGYLDLAPGGDADQIGQLGALKKNLVLYQANGKAIELPMTWDEQFSEFGVGFSAYRGAYVLRPRAPKGTPIGIAGPWPKGLPLKVYLLWANGKTESVSIPYDPAEYVTSPQVVKRGWVFGGGNFYRASGLYLFDGALVSKLDVGLVKETAASQDGCKVAVAIQNDHLNMGTPTKLKIFDFCEAGR